MRCAILDDDQNVALFMADWRPLEGLVATPHLGYVTDETYRIFFSDVIDDIAGWLAGTPVRVLNDPAPTPKRC